MSLEVEPWGPPGCLRLRTAIHRDARGTFQKPFQHSAFAAHGLPVDWTEQFFSVSESNVLRGLHLQLPPSEQWKLVMCLSGSVLDVALDLGAGSPTYGEHATCALSGDDPVALLLPPWVAHGFLTTSGPALMAYWVTAEHDPARDAGVRWDSAGIDWPLRAEPVVSARDAALPRLEEFASPFTPGGQA